MAPTGTKRRSVRQAAGRKRSVYAEPDTDDDFEEPQAEPEATAVHEPATKRRRIATRPRRPKTRSSKSATSQPRKPTRPHLRAVGKPRKPNTHQEVKHRDFSGPSDRVIPAWTSLPIDILREVFQYASMPIHEQTTTAMLARTLPSFCPASCSNDVRRTLNRADKIQRKRRLADADGTHLSGFHTPCPRSVLPVTLTSHELSPSLPTRAPGAEERHEVHSIRQKGPKPLHRRKTAGIHSTQQSTFRHQQAHRSPPATPPTRDRSSPRDSTFPTSQDTEVALPTELIPQDGRAWHETEDLALDTRHDTDRRLGGDVQHDGAGTHELYF